MEKRKVRRFGGFFIKKEGMLFFFLDSKCIFFRKVVFIFEMLGCGFLGFFESRWCVYVVLRGFIGLLDKFMWSIY